MMSLLRTTPLLLALVLTAAPSARSTTVITDVDIVDVVSGRLLEDRTVTLRDGRIASITSGPAGAVAEDATHIAGQGLYLLPGLIDSHVHMADAENYAPMLLVHGVTLVRDLGGATTPTLALRDSLNEGRSVGPEMICTGAILDGKDPVWPFSEECDTEEKGRKAVRKLKGMGVDQIKVYSKLEKSVHRAILDECEKAGIRAVGHVPSVVPIEEAVEAGQLTIEHMTGLDELIGRLAGRHEIGDRLDFFQTFAYWSLYPEVSPVVLHAKLKEMAKVGVAHVPTLIVMHGMTRSDGSGKKHPQYKYVNAGMRAFWDGRGPAFGERIRGQLPHLGSMAGALHKAGTTLLAGTDLANPYVFAGESLHEEIELLHRVGLTRAEALRTATLNPSRVFGLADEYGTVAEGKVASLVLLRKNPLDDIRNTREIEGVFLRGRHFSTGDLARIADEVESRVQGAEAVEGDVDLEVAGTVVYRGTYRTTFNNMDSGTEDFVLTRDGDRLRFSGHSKPRGFGSPSITEITANDTEVLSMEWRTLTESPIVATYTLGSGEARATATQDGKELPAQKIPVSGEAHMAGPTTAGEFFLFRGLELAVGDSLTYQGLGFGYPSWNLQSSPTKVTRLPDGEVQLPDGSTCPVLVYRTELTTPMGQLVATNHCNREGFVVRSEMKLPFGTIGVTLSEFEHPGTVESHD